MDLEHLERDKMKGISPYNSPYPINSGELDLRQEIHNTLYGAADEISKGRIGFN